MVVGDDVRHERPPALLAAQVPLGAQLVEDEGDGGAGDVERLGKPARPGEADPRGEPSLQDGPSQGGVQLPLQWFDGLGVEREGERDRTPSTCGSGLISCLLSGHFDRTSDGVKSPKDSPFATPPGHKSLITPADRCA
jgi:hypothetical protein